MRILRVAAILVAAGVLACLAGISTGAAQAACADLNGTVGPDGVCTVHTSNSTYTLDITFPNDYPDQQALTAYLTQARDGFVNVSEMPGSYNLPYELDAKGTGYRSDTPTGGTRSVVFTMWQNVGGVHPQTWYKSFNWDIGKKAPITFDTLFKPGTKPLDVIYPAVEQYHTEAAGVDRRHRAQRRARPEQVPELRADRRRGDLLLRPGRAVCGVRGSCRGVRPARDAGSAVGVAPTPARSRRPGRRWWR